MNELMTALSAYIAACQVTRPPVYDPANPSESTGEMPTHPDLPMLKFTMGDVAVIKAKIILKEANQLVKCEDSINKLFDVMEKQDGTKPKVKPSSTPSPISDKREL